MKKHMCSNCGSDAHVVRGDYEFRESGLDYVVLHNIELITCAGAAIEIRSFADPSA